MRMSFADDQHISKTLLNLSGYITNKPSDKVPCVSCKHCLWVEQPAYVEGYCRILFRTIHDKNTKCSIRSCDGPNQ